VGGGEAEVGQRLDRDCHHDRRGERRQATGRLGPRTAPGSGAPGSGVRHEHQRARL